MRVFEVVISLDDRQKKYRLPMNSELVHAEFVEPKGAKLLFESSCLTIIRWEVFSILNNDSERFEPEIEPEIEVVREIVLTGFLDGKLTAVYRYRIPVKKCRTKGCSLFVPFDEQYCCDLCKADKKEHAAPCGTTGRLKIKEDEAVSANRKQDIVQSQSGGE